MKYLKLCPVVGFYLLLLISTFLFTPALTEIAEQVDGLQLTATKTVLKEGETTVLTCEPPSFTGENGQQVQWYKYERDDGNKARMLGGHFQLDSAYRDFKDDLSVSADQPSPDKAVFTLTIANAKVEYSGVYMCDLYQAGSSQNMQTIVIDVIRGPSRVDMVVGSDPVTEDQHVELDNVQRQHFSCSAEGANPAPRVELVAVHAGGYERWMTGLLMTEVDEVEFSAGVASGFEMRNGVKTISGQVELSSRTLGDFNTLLCRAYTQALDDSVIESPRYTVEFKGNPPHIHCNELRINSEPYKRDLGFNCSVHADPPVDDFRLDFPVLHFTDELRTQTVHGEGSYGHNLRVYRTTPLQSDPMRSNIIVRIDYAAPQMFRKYTLSVANSKGTEKVELVLETEFNFDELTENEGTTLKMQTSLFLICLVTGITSLL